MSSAIPAAEQQEESNIVGHDTKLPCSEVSPKESSGNDWLVSMYRIDAIQLVPVHFSLEVSPTLFSASQMYTFPKNMVKNMQTPVKKNVYRCDF